ncbi:hypothetical protein ACRQ4B_06025 [Curtobacterium sp. SP.BCo]|uniref:hypothetical protein n=1 Tax=Curtobacterium sp. SP.BCo TaxID=3435229 RepID=UPI003F731AAE
MNARPALQPEDAKSRVQTLVDASTAALGGRWIADEEEPRLGTCMNERGEGEGVKYTYIKRRAEHGHTERDIATLERLWQSEGFDTARFKDGHGVTMGVNGSGAAVQGVGFYSLDGGDSVSGTSWCAAGDYGEMRDRGEE